MKLRAPEGCASICHDGQIFIVEADGSIDVADALAAILGAHGFTPWETGAILSSAPTLDLKEPAGAAREDVDIAALNRSGLFAFLRAHGTRGARHATNAELRAAARQVLKAQSHPV